MSEEYAREHLRRNVAQICQTIGWNGVNSTPLDILVHVLEKFIRTVGTQANIYTEQFNRTELNLHDIGLAFRDLHIQLPDLVEYTRSVPPVPSPLNVDKFPKPKEPNLNFLKPGSHEVVTRPMHVHEHLPPMYPEKERETPVVADTVEIRQNGIDTPGPSNATCTSPEISVTDSPEKNKDIFKRPNDPIAAPNSKKPRLRLEEEERTREISSVIMTMSGFLSPAREGKLPEAKAPTIVSEKHHDKQKANSHHSGLLKVPMHPSLEKSDKKSKKNKLLNGKIMKSKRRDKSHKGESSRSKDSKSDKYPPGHPSKSKEVAPSIYNHVTMPVPKLECQPSNKISPLPKAVSIPIPLPLPLPLVPESLKSVIKQEPVDLPIAAIPPVLTHKNTVKEDAIPVPRRIPISKSPLVNPLHVNKNPTPGLLMPGIEIKKEKLDEEEKLASQPDRSKINIFKRISNKTKEDKNTPEVVQEKSQSNTMISRLHNSSPHESTSEESKVKTQDSVVNNNDDSAVDLSKEMDLTTNEVISLDDDSYDMSPMPLIKPIAAVAPRPQLTINKALQVPFPKDIPTGSPKIKKERKHREKKDKSAEKAAKLEAKLIKKQQQQIAYEIAKAEKQSLKLANMKSRKLNRPKNDSSKMSQLPPGFPFFPNIPGRGLMPGPGLMPNPGLIPGGDFLAGLANNPALRGLHPPNLLANPFALGAGGPGLIPGPSLFPGALGPGMPNPLMSMSNFGHSSRSSNKIPTMLRRPSLEVIPVENDDRSTHKSPIMSREKDRHDKHKSPTIPNILQKQKSKSHKEGHKSNMYKMPPIHPDITIELNPPKPEPAKQEPPSAPQPPVHTHTPTPEPVKEPEIIQIEDPPPKVVQDKVEEKLDKKKDKSHKKEKKDKDFIKIKKKKDKKGKNKDKSEKKKKKEDKQEVKDKIKEEKKEKKKEKPVDGIVPKLTLKLGSASPMPPSSPDVVRLNIKPVVKKEDERSPSPKEEPVSRESSRSPELAQFSALVTRPPKQKHKHNNSSDTELKLSPPSSSSPSRKNRPPSSHKYKRISFKTLAKKGHVEQLDDDIESISDDAALPGPPPTTEQTPGGPLKTPYYVDEHGNKIWVCPACGRPDNGTPMIGCDGCDGWYHWICVGITEEPGATEDWFCKSCIAKRAAMVLAGVTAGKKRGKKAKGEKIRDC